jgi:hypothetical protein
MPAKSLTPSSNSNGGRFSHRSPHPAGPAALTGPHCLPQKRPPPPVRCSSRPVDGMAAGANVVASPKAHVVIGGFPSTSHAGHDMDSARLRLLTALSGAGAEATCSTNFLGIEDQLRGGIQLLITYTAGPLPDAAQSAELERWLEGGGRWVALHGTCGGKAAKPRDGEKQRRMTREPFHDVLGCAFLNHPPQRTITCHTHLDGGGASSSLLAGVPSSFDCEDEPYIVQLTVDPQDPSLHVFMTFQCSDEEARPGGPPPANNWGSSFLYDTHPALDGPSGSTLCIGCATLAAVSLCTHPHKPTCPRTHPRTIL